MQKMMLGGSMLKKYKPSKRDSVMIFAGILVTIAGFMGMNVVKNSKTTIPYQPEGITADWIPPTVKHWDTQINEMAKKYDIDPDLIAIIMTLESGGDPKAKSEADALGLMQVTPPTAQDIAAKFLKQPVSRYDLLDPATNIEFGTAYLAYLRDEFGTVAQGPDWLRTVELVAAGYNGGTGASNNLEQGKGLADPQTVVYSRDAFNMYRERVSGKSLTYERWKERGGSELIEAAQKTQK